MSSLDERVRDPRGGYPDVLGAETVLSLVYPRSANRVVRHVSIRTLVPQSSGGGSGPVAGATTAPPLGCAAMLGANGPKSKPCLRYQFRSLPVAVTRGPANRSEIVREAGVALALVTKPSLFGPKCRGMNDDTWARIKTVDLDRSCRDPRVLQPEFEALQP